MLMEQLKQIKRELGIEKDDKDSILQAFRDAIEGREIPEEALKVTESARAARKKDSSYSKKRPPPLLWLYQLPSPFPDVTCAVPIREK